MGKIDKKVDRRVTGKVARALLVLFLALGFGIFVGQGQSKAAEKEEYQTLAVHFIDVGQGDATLITCDGHAMLIDAADDTKGTFLQNYLKKQKVKKLDYLILTHPDSDHIGSAPVILTKFPVEKVFVSNYEKDNQTYRKLIQALDDVGKKQETPRIGSKWALGDATFTILGPRRTYEEPNNASIVLMVEHGENRFLFTGDAEEEAENDIRKAKVSLKADVYKAGHHGSRTASSPAFLDAVGATYGVISCGEQNRYGHPHVEVLNNLRKRGIQVYRTDLQGSLVAESDGQKLTWNAAPEESWKAGEAAGTEKGQKTGAATGTKKSQKTGEDTGIGKNSKVSEVTGTEKTEGSYVLNSKTKKFHRSTCQSLPTTNRKDSDASREELIKEGYEPCKKCKP